MLYKSTRNSSKWNVTYNQVVVSCDTSALKAKVNEMLKRQMKS